MSSLTMRLRIFDLKTPWFWFVSFYQQTYGKPRLEIAVYDGPGDRRWGLHCWEWEEMPGDWLSYGYIDASEVPEGDGSGLAVVSRNYLRDCENNAPALVRAVGELESTKAALIEAQNSAVENMARFLQMTK